MSEENNVETNVNISLEEKKTTVEDKTNNGLYKNIIITLETENEVLKKIEKHCNTWNTIATSYNICITVFGLSAIITSVLVSIYTGQDDQISVKTIKVLACISTISLSILTAFSLVSNATNARTAWRSLNAAMMLYKTGSISIQQLIEQYQKGENQMGYFGFTYGSNNNIPATYSSDVNREMNSAPKPQEEDTLEKEKKK